MRTGRIASVLAALGVSACVDTSAHRCQDDSVCPASLVCHTLAEPDRTTCVTEDQLAACGDSADLTACKLGDLPGTCFGGACFLAVCGDGIVDLTEACDLGDRDPGGGCSADCMSRELCGDQLIDLALGEQCDEGMIGLSGDGCSSTCSSEYDVWRDLTPRHPGVRSDQALARAPGGGVMIFGGTPGGGASSPSAALSDAWRWDGVNWSRLVSATAPPPARAGAAAAYDPARGHFMLFGGRDVDGLPLDDLWRWDGVAWTLVTSAGPRPTARWNASLACSTTRCIVNGGRTEMGILDDTWAWNGTSWTEVTGPKPPARTRGALVHDTTRDVFVMFGGHDPAPRQDTWELGSQWTQISTASIPPAVTQPAATYDDLRDTVVLVAGTQTWRFKSDIISTEWINTGYLFSQLSPALAYDAARDVVVAVGQTNTPQERAGAAWNPTPNNRKPGAAPLALLATYVPRRGRTLVVEPGATWEWDGRSWKAVTATSPPLPVNAGIAFDRACDRAVVFGGGTGAGAIAQTWTFDGAWTNRAISAPSARSLHAMTYDAKRDVVVVFGGVDTANQLLGDVWELRGPCTSQVWTRVPTTTGPSPRASARLAFDPLRGVSVLFGGEAGTPLTPQDDTWEWDGTAWTSRSPTQKPPARKDHAMVYDPRRGAVVMFGGSIEAVFRADSWQWDGAAWTQLSPITSPPARRAMTIATDVTGGLVIFGGESEAAGNLTDVWRLGAETNTAPIERCAVGGVDEDGDGLATCDDPDCGLRCAPLCPLGTSCTGPSCGDGMCGAVEDYVLCPADCTAP